MNTNDSEWDVETSSDRGRLGIILDQYRALVYAVGAIVFLAALGAAIDAMAGPLNDNTELMHQIAGLLGATAVALAFCLFLVVVLWGILVVTNR